MRDTAKITGARHHGQRRTAHRNKGQGRERTNVARRTEDKGSIRAALFDAKRQALESGDGIGYQLAVSLRHIYEAER